MTEANKNVYVVDDDESVRRSLTRLFRSAGLSVRTFPSAEAFQEAAPPDDEACLVLDVHLPGMSGLDLRKILVESHSPLCVILMTAHDNDQTRAVEARGDAILLYKPFDTTRLLKLVQQALRI